MTEDAPVDPSADIRTSLAADETHPVYSSDSRWVTSLIIGIAGLLVAAILIGPIVRSEAPDAVPIAISHEEDPAADRH